MGFCLLPRAGRRPRPHHVCRLSPRAGAGRTFATGCSASCGRRLTAASPGYEDVNDAERLARDPAMRAIVGRVGLDRPAASSSEMGRFETRWLATEANLAALTDLFGAWIDRVHRCRPPDDIILDMDSSEGTVLRGGFHINRGLRRPDCPGCGAHSHLWPLATGRGWCWTSGSWT